VARSKLESQLPIAPEPVWDRIIVGEVRSGEAFDMLQAMNTGHEGSMTTVHANSPRDALGRVEQMIGMAGLEISSRSIRQQIASAIHVIVQAERLEDGRRRIVSISEIVGMEEDMISMQEIFKFRRLGRDADGLIQGQLETTGVRPKFMEMFASRGIRIPPEIFVPGRVSQ
jgi:pilus assembly protein CpaF